VYQINPRVLEAIHPVSRHPALQTQISMSIAKSRESTIAEEKGIDKGTKIFTDGSSQDGCAGAVAVLLRASGHHKVLRVHMGELTECTVFECELAGLLLAAELIHCNPSALEPYHIFLDNQVAIKAPMSVMLCSGQQLANAVYSALCKPCCPGRHPPEVLIHWIVSHEGVLGNELADKHAKQAAAGDSSPTNQLPACSRRLSPQTQWLYDRSTTKS